MLQSFKTFCNPILQLNFSAYSTPIPFLRNGGNGSLSAFWISYVDMVETILGFIRAAREGNWLLHLSCVLKLIMWSFANDKLNYAWYLPIYYAQMTQLPQTHPHVHKHMMNGGFSVQLGSENPFGKLPADQVIEETVNKDTQTAGGTKDFSLKPGAVTKYYVSAEHRSTCLKQIREMTRITSKFSHADLQTPRIKRDEQDEEALIAMLETNWINPMRTEADLVSISTGQAATKQTSQDLANAHTIGEQAYQEFKEKRIQSEPPRVKFHDTMKKQNLKTFTNMIKKQGAVNVAGKEQLLVIKADRNLFSQMILVAQ